MIFESRLLVAYEAVLDTSEFMTLTFGGPNRNSGSMAGFEVSGQGTNDA